MTKRWVLWLVFVLALAGCGRQRGSEEPEELGFEERADTTALSRGAPLLRSIEPYRMANGAMRVRGKLDFPDGARVQISIHRRDTNQMVGRVHVFVQDGGFDSPPILGPGGPLPSGRYRFEVLTYFTGEWQSSEVLQATRNGVALRGPGMTRDRLGQPSFYLVREARL